MNCDLQGKRVSFHFYKSFFDGFPHNMIFQQLRDFLHDSLWNCKNFYHCRKPTTIEMRFVLWHQFEFYFRFSHGFTTDRIFLLNSLHISRAKSKSIKHVQEAQNVSMKNKFINPIFVKQHEGWESTYVNKIPAWCIENFYFSNNKYYLKRQPDIIFF